MVTGADHSHFRSLVQFLTSYFQFENEKIIVYDLGLTVSENRKLKKQFPSIDLRIFDYSKYPPYFNINIASGEYAWKPVIIHEVFYEFKGCICWMDAGNLIVNKLTNIRKIISKKGFYSPISRGKIIRWTHPGTLEYLKCEKEFLNMRNLTAGCVALNYKYPLVKQLVDKWKECALKKECIAPEGSSRKNHRQDLSVLSILAYQLSLAQRSPRMYHGFLVQKDIEKRNGLQ